MKKQITEHTKASPRLSESKPVAEDTMPFAPLDTPIATGTMALATLENKLVQIRKLKKDTVRSLEKENKEFLQVQEQKLRETRIKLQEKLQEAVDHIENAEVRVKFEISFLKVGEASMAE